MQPCRRPERRRATCGSVCKIVICGQSEAFKRVLWRAGIIRWGQAQFLREATIFGLNRTEKYDSLTKLTAGPQDVDSLVEDGRGWQENRIVREHCRHGQWTSARHKRVGREVPFLSAMSAHNDPDQAKAGR